MKTAAALPYYSHYWQAAAIVVKCITAILLIVVVVVEGKPDPAIFQARSLAELQSLGKNHPGTKKRRTPEQVLRGRRRLEDGTLETSTHVLADAVSDGGTPGFYHSVASGDPLSDAVVIWTRYTPISETDEIALEFRITAVNRNNKEMDSDHSLFNPTANAALRRGKVIVTRATDFVAKIDITGLPSNTEFAFVFSDGTQTSDIGMTKTTPAPGDDDADDLVYAFFSCAHFSNGYFHAYDMASTIEDLDVAFFLGDYYYEYGIYDTYSKDAAEQRDQFILPKWETIDLQDYRNRHASYLAHDEGLQNIRRRVPIMAFWDDHETANDSWCNTVEGCGAQNHQETCPINRPFSSASDAEKNAANCDRDEGDAVERFTAAAQAFWEWMPLRHAEGSMGPISTGTITKVMEWGDLATMVGFDTRLSYRTQKSTGESAFFNTDYGTIVNTEKNVSAYSDPNSAIYPVLADAVAKDMQARREGVSMIGEYIHVLEDAFSQSKQAGKPWQIWAGNTMVGNNVAAPVSEIYLDASSTEIASLVRATINFILSVEDGVAARVNVALSAFDVEWNLDDFGGFPEERKQILQMAKNSTNNMVILGGDLHNGYAWILREDGGNDGTPVGINLGCPSVTSPGFARTVLPLVAPIYDSIGGDDEFYSLMQKAWLRRNPNLKLSQFRYSGFVAVRATRQTHTAEYFSVSNTDRISDYDTARAAAGNAAIIAAPICSGSVTTQADTPGSLEFREDCSTIVFMSPRPAIYNLPVPALDSMPEGEALKDCGMIGCTFNASLVTPDSSPSRSPTMGTDSSPSAAVSQKDVAKLVTSLICIVAGGWGLLL